MTMSRAVPTGVPPGTMAVLMLSVFTVSMGFGILLPILPYLIERLLGAGGDAAQVSRSTGLLTGLYTLSLFLFAPVWGRLSDRYGRRTILLIGLIGFGATMLTFAFIENLPAVYAERFLSGMFAAAVTPVAMAAIGDLAATEEARARRLTFVSLAGISGFLLGPTLGVFIARNAANILPIVSAAGSLAVPLTGTAVLAFLVAVAAVMTVPGTKQGNSTPQRDRSPSEAAAWLVPKLLSLAFIVSAGVGVFEVGLALRGKQELGLTQYQIALMFTECSLVMFIVQAIVFSPWIKPETTRWFIAPALAVLAAGLFLVPRASDFMLMLAVIGAVAASAGILSPILTYWISSKAGRAQGAELGKQTAAASLGATMGSAAGGLLFDVALLPNASFLLMTVLTVLGILLSLGLPNRLVTRKIVEYADDTDADVRRDANQRVTEASVSRIGTSPAQAIPTVPAPANLA
jgi:MFS family permease